MKKLMAVAIFLTTSLIAFTQGPPPVMQGGMPGGGLPQGKINGKLVSQDGKALAGATVLLMEVIADPATQNKKLLLAQTYLTKASGAFNFEDLTLNKHYLLKISNTGYQPSELPVDFLLGPGVPPKAELDLGNIKLSADVKELQNVTVAASASSIKFSGEKKVFNVEKNIMSAGGTGVDVMRNVPSVNVDIDGNITMRNSAPQLLVDGRPTTLTLEQIPADAIESVEVISNPSAKYDASGGGAGILNIVLKKNKKTGYNGNVRAGIDKRGAVNGGFDFNLQQNKVNISASLNGNQMKDRTTGHTTRLSLGSDPQTSITQNNYNKNSGGFVFAKAGVDYFATPKTTLSFSGIKVHGDFNPTETIDISTDSLFNAGKVNTLSNRTTTNDREFNGQGLVFGFKKQFARKGEEWTVDANYFGGKMNNQSLYVTKYLAANGGLAGTDLQTVVGASKDKNFVIQTDYVLPVKNQLKFEAGLRAAMRSRETENNNYLFNDSAGNYVLVPNAASNYTNKDNVYAAYVTLSNSIKDFGYKIGVRAESSSYTGTLTKNNQQFKNDYPVSLFPSIFLSQKLASKQELQLSYSRRINRPNFFQLIPFTDYTDPLNITRGNPDLVPEFTQSLELSYLKAFQGNNTLLGSVYYKHTDNLITRYLSEEQDAVTGNPTLINTYINANTSYAAGAEITSVNTLAKWWDISTNINVYNSKVNSGVSPAVAQNDIWSLFGKFNSNFKLPSNFAIQFTTTYQSKTNLPVSSGGGMGPMQQSQSSSQGYIKPSWGMDLAVKKSFLKNNAASVSLSISDIFKTRIMSQYSYSDYFVQDYSRLRDPQMVRLNLSYRFGKIDASLFNRKSSNADRNVSESIQQ